MAMQSQRSGNAVERIFYGRVVIEFATSLFFYEDKGMVQRLIHQLKYQGQEGLSSLFGQWMGEELLQCRRFPKIDYVVPVPLSRIKQRKRGYNQVARFGQEIAHMIHARFLDNQLKIKQKKETQTTKNRFERWLNVKDQFYLEDPSVFENASLLIVDDVITTGATLEACCYALLKSETIKISIVTMAYTS